MSARNIVVTLSAVTDKFNQNITAASTKVKTLGTESATAGTKSASLGSKVAGLGSKFGTAAIGIGSTAAQVVGLARQYRDLEDTQIKSLDVGRIVRATGDSTVDKLIFGFSDKDMPFNSAFKVCAISIQSGHENCEQADRHGSVGSAAIFVQVP